ncbi:MAG: exonuclease subunit SbcD [Bacteroidales bacterium]|nr:exonuclease subunit SbcD [Bacteroidales bacterium]
MKIIHTADWHLGHKLYNYNREDEQRFFLEQIADCVKTQQPDALVVSGDIFDTGMPNIETQALFVEELKKIHEQYRQMVIVVIAGNHDSYSRLEIDKLLWRELNTYIIGNISTDLSTHIIPIADKGYIAAVPFCSSRNFPLLNEDDAVADRQTSYFNALADKVKQLNTSQLPVVLMAHLAVSGCDVKGHTVTKTETAEMIGGLEYVQENLFSSEFDYVALGHIHHPQFVGKNKRIRYSGTPFPVSFDEEYEHSVSIVELKTHGTEPECTEFPLQILRPVCTLPTQKSAKPHGDSLENIKKLLQTHLENDEYIRVNVNFGPDDSPALMNQDIEKLVEGHACHFCLINPIREITAGQTIAQQKISIDEIKNLTQSEIVDIIKSNIPLSDEEITMFKEILNDNTNIQ